MTTITALPTAPSRADPANFRTRADAFMAALPTFATETNTVAGEVNTNATTATTQAGIATTQAGIATTQAALADASADAAASAASVAAWVNGNTYALNAAAISQQDFQTYRKITASSVTTVDPASDPTNWVPLGWLHTVAVTGTTHASTRGTRAILTNVAATAVTAPSAIEGAEFEVIPANGLYTNTVDFGAKTVQGPAGSASGVITLDAGLPLRARFNLTLDKWVTL